MNFEKLKGNVGYRMKLVPPACHIDAAGAPFPIVDEDWTIITVDDQFIEIAADSGHSYRLGKDHIRNFTTDPQRAVDGKKHGFLTLLVQLFVEGEAVRAVPNP